MTSPRRITFGPYSLDLDGGQLWKGADPVALQPRPLAVLRYLAERPGQVVGRDEMIGTLWAGTFVTKAVLKVAVRAVRAALDDDADDPRYVETVGHGGYRFIGDGGTVAAARARVPTIAPPMVGRDGDLATLHAALARTVEGVRQVVFVTGEAGIGKTTLLERFVADVERDGQAWVAHGQCLEQYGEGEAYLPVLEAIGRLVREDRRNEFAAVLRQHAPAWVSQLPVLTADDTARVDTGMPAGTTAARMLREMADALEVFTRGRALVLILEDLHWSDHSTVDLIACLARRREPARLLVVGTFRPADVIAHDHPLRAVRQELQASGHCVEIPLELLSSSEVGSYVAARLGCTISDPPAAPAAPLRGRKRPRATATPRDESPTPSDDLRALAAHIHDRTEGNALFMVNVVNDLIAQGMVVWRDDQWKVEGSVARATERIPSGLRDVIARRLDRLTLDARRTLEVASVAGEEFAVAAVAAGLDANVDAVEDRCEELAGALIADAGLAEWPDRVVTGRYRFVHSLYRHVLYDGIADARRIRLHRTIGLREETAWAKWPAEHAAELAMHFERGRDDARALAYHELAASTALERHAAHEAVGYYAAARAALARVPELPDRAERELAIVVANATLLMATRGYAAPEVERAFADARALCDALPGSPKIFPVLRGLISYHHVRAELTAAHELGEILLRHIATNPADRVLRVQVHYGHGATLFHQGDLLAAREHFERALAEYEPASHHEHITVYGGYDPGVACSLWLAWTLMFLGRLDDAVARDREGLALARRLDDPFTRAWAYYAASASQQLFGDGVACEPLAAEAVRLADEGGFPHVLAMATVNRGWALMTQGKPGVGIPILRRGIAAVDATGARLVRPLYLGMLATAATIEGDRHEAVARLDEALAEIERTGERWHEAPLLTGKGQLLATERPPRKSADAAEACFRRALDVARAQEARLLELRAAIALARHCLARRRSADGRAPLAAVHAWFTDAGIHSAEVATAGALLTELR